MEWPRDPYQLAPSILVVYEHEVAMSIATDRESLRQGEEALHRLRKSKNPAAKCAEEGVYAYVQWLKKHH